MKRILQLGMSTNPGGIENYIMNIYRNMDRSKIQFDFLLPFGYPKIFYEDEIIKLGGKIYREFFGIKTIIRNPKYINEGPRKFFSMHSEISGVQFNSVYINSFMKYVIYAKKIGLKPVILHSHNSDYLQKLTIKEKVYEIFIKKRLKNLNIKLIACSENAGKWMFGRNDFDIIYNPIDVNKFSYNEMNRKKIRNKYNISDDEFVLGTVARMQYQKNPLFNIKVINELLKKNSKVKFLYVGDGNLNEDVKNLINKYHINNNVILVGKQKNIPDFLSAMDAFVLPSRFEGLPISLIEAQASGLKCYVSNSITKEVDCTSNIRFLPIEDDDEKIWSKNIITNQTNRIVNKNNFEKFEINSCIRKIENIYLS